jgi:hypothetical protein
MSQAEQANKAAVRRLIAQVLSRLRQLGLIVVPDPGGEP